MTKEIKDKFAILYVQAAQMHPICSNLDWPDSLKKIYRNHNKKISAFCKEHFPKQITVRGFCQNDAIEHYDIDEALRKKFNKEQVQPDSEGGGFYCYTNSETVDKVTAFLTKKFPDLDYVVDKDEDDDDYIKPFTNWNDAEDYVEKNNIEVPPIFDGTDMLEKLSEFDNKIKALEKEREEYLESIN